MSNVNPTMTAIKAYRPAVSQQQFPEFTLVSPDECASLMDQLDSILRLLGDMLAVHSRHPRIRADIRARIDSVLDERLRLQRLAAGILSV